jgi:hypothetical protein
MPKKNGGSSAGTRVAVGQGMRPSFVILTFSCLPLTAHADFVPVLPGPCERVVAARDHVAVLRKGDIWILREDGSVLGRIAKADHAKEVSGTPTAKQEAEHMLDLLDVSEIDRDTDYTDGLLDSEQRLAERQRSRQVDSHAPAPADPSTALAASASDIWIADQRGLLRIGPHGSPIRELVREGWGAPLAVAGQSLLVARGSSLALLSMPVGPRRFFQLSSDAQKVALSASGQKQAWTTSAGIAWTSNFTSPETFAPQSAVADLTYCGETLVVMLADFVVIISPNGQPEVRSRNRQVHRLICPEEPGTPWLAVGKTLMASSDQGRHWEDLPAPAALVDVAASTHHLWLATRDGLYASADGHVPVPTPTANPAIRHAHVSHRGATWFSWMPKVSIRAAAEVATGKQHWEALAFASFPLDARKIPVTSAALGEDAVAEPVNPPIPARRTEHFVDIRDPDEHCLTSVRRKAVELAMTEPERARSYITRSGHAAWLPELRVLVSRRYGRSESVDASSSSTALSSPIGIDTVNDIRYEARATWDLGKLIFSPEELTAQTQALHMAELRRDIETTVNRLYFERRGLALDLSDSRTDVGRRHLRTSEIEAELNAMSAGEFGTCISGRVGE